MSQARDPKYSWVFQKLTENDQGQFNLESIVAYTIYKKQKIAFIDEIKSRKTREPNAAEWETFHTLCESDSSLTSYRNHASNIVAQLLTVAFAAEISALESQELLESKVNAELDKLKIQLTTIDGYIDSKQSVSGWFSDVGKNFLVNILTIFAIGGFATFVINFDKVSNWFKSFF